MPHSVLPAFGLTGEEVTIESFGSGIINSTWKLTTPGQQYILQRINTNVFKRPEAIAENIKLVAAYLGKHHPNYYFVAPFTSSNGEEMIHFAGKGFFRLFPFVPGSHSKDVVNSPEEAYEASLQFGRFTRLLSGFNSTALNITIPDFHNLDLRYRQFLQALKFGNCQHIKVAGGVIKALLGYEDLVKEYNFIRSNPEFRVRVTHHDTKISNVLFNAENKGICVIDLDTIMPGYFISDVGDMMRTYLSPVSEEEHDFSKIEVRSDYYKAIVQGYYNEMKEELTKTEKNYFFYAGKFMIYMQALRFLTDHLNNDVYYGARYEGHNFVRAQNQLVLLQQLVKQQDILKNW